MSRFDDSLPGIRRAWPARWMIGGSLATLAFAGVAQAQTGDILLNMIGTPMPGTQSRITRFHADGSHVWDTTGGTGSGWEGCAITSQGHVITSRRNPASGFNVFDSGGVQIATFDTPQVSFPGDVSIFADGTIAIVDQIGYDVDLYTEAGAYVASFAPAGMSYPFGSFVDSSDNLWVCKQSGPLYKLSRTGALLATFPISFHAGDMVVPADGTLWVTSPGDRMLMHLSAGGTVLGFIQTNAGDLNGVALATDGSFFVTGVHTTKISHYSSAGDLLGTFPVGLPTGMPLFLNFISCGFEPSVYCTAKTNSLGCLPAISSSGMSSATMTSGFVVRGDNVRNNKHGLLFYGTTGRSALPFQGGTLCVKTPLRRTSGTNSGGAPPPADDCSGVFSIDMNLFAHSAGPPLPLPALTVPGTQVNCQWWGRDQGFAAPNNTTLTDALEYVVCP